MIILSPRAVERLETYTPPWPLPKIFRMTAGGKLNAALFEGETINTPSMLCIEDYIVALEWAKRMGGLKGLQARANANAATIDKWISRTPWAHHLAKDAAVRSNTSVCLTLDGDAKTIAKLLEKEGVALDIGAYRDAPPGLRIWCGATVETSDVEALMPWLDWTHASLG